MLFQRGNTGKEKRDFTRDEIAFFLFNVHDEHLKTEQPKSTQIHGDRTRQDEMASHHSVFQDPGRVGNSGQNDVLHPLDGQLQLLLVPLQHRVPGLKVCELLLLHLGGLFPLGPASAAGQVVQVPGSAVTGLGRIARGREVDVSRWRPTTASATGIK